MAKKDLATTNGSEPVEQPEASLVALSLAAIPKDLHPAIRTILEATEPTRGRKTLERAIALVNFHTRLVASNIDTVKGVLTTNTLTRNEGHARHLTAVRATQNALEYRPEDTLRDQARMFNIVGADEMSKAELIGALVKIFHPVYVEEGSGAESDATVITDNDPLGMNT